MADRPTVEFTSGEHKVVAYAYFTSAEADQLEDIMIAGIAVETPDRAGATVARPKIPAANMIAYERARIKKGLVSIDGDTNAGTVLDNLPSDDAASLAADMKAAAPRLFLAKKKTPDTPSPSSTKFEMAPN
jgi:hypothetical protein